MTKEQMLLNTAKAMGFELWGGYKTDTNYPTYPTFCKTRDDVFCLALKQTDDSFIAWNPLESSADCAEMEDALRINVNWADDGLECSMSRWVDGLYKNHMESALFKDHKNKGASRRYASTMVAAMIGSKM